MKPALTLHLLGPMRLSIGEQNLEVPSRKARGLLAYLAMRQGIAVPRETLCGLLWGDRGEEQARASVRQTLSALRKALGTEASCALAASHDSVTLDSNAISTDVGQLERAAKSDSIAELESAAELYRGDLLEGLSLDEPAFEQWASGERERLRATAQKVLSRLVELLQAESRIEEAISATARLLSLDPLQENVHRTLMQLYVEQGRYDAALNQFERCRKRLAEVLGVQPEQETRDLAADVRSKRRQPKTEQERLPSTSNSNQLERLSQEGGRSAIQDKPSIAVLPFTNMSGDPEQEYFADGIAEDLITQLSRLRDLVVIARQSSFVFKGCTASISEITQKLAARYVLQGSVRRVTNRLRVTAQLVDSARGGPIWAEHYDREVADLFDLQDEITKATTVALQVNLTEGEVARIVAEGTRNLRAWELYTQGQAAFMEFTKPDNLRARRLFEAAIAQDPEYGLALAKLATTHWMDARFRYTADIGASLELAKTFLKHANEKTGESGPVLSVQGIIALMERQHSEALELEHRAMELAPSDAYCAAALGMTQIYSSEFQEAVISLKTSLRLSPIDINWATYYLSFAYLWLNELELACQAAVSYLERDSKDPYAYLLSAITEAASGRVDASRSHVSALLSKHPEMTCEHFAHAQYYRDPQLLERLITWLKDAGLPER